MTITSQNFNHLEFIFLRYWFIQIFVYNFNLQKPGQENLAENFITSADLIYFSKINQNLYKLKPIDTDANTNASAIQKLRYILRVITQDNIKNVFKKMHSVIQTVIYSFKSHI